jgi:hypothetical protein
MHSLILPSSSHYRDRTCVHLGTAQSMKSKEKSVKHSWIPSSPDSFFNVVSG